VQGDLAEKSELQEALIKSEELRLQLAKTLINAQVGGGEGLSVQTKPLAVHADKQSLAAGLHDLCASVYLYRRVCICLRVCICVYALSASAHAYG
jgi:hypothetical protein